MAAFLLRQRMKKEILFTVEWDCYHGCVIREDVSEYFSALQKEQPVFYDLMGKLDIDHLEQAWNKKV